MSLGYIFTCSLLHSIKPSEQNELEAAWRVSYRCHAGVIQVNERRRDPTQVSHCNNVCVDLAASVADGAVRDELVQPFAGGGG